MLAAISEEYERDPLYHPSTRRLCAVYGDMIAHGLSEAELGGAEQLLRETQLKHQGQILNQKVYKYTPRSLDEALVFVCTQALERLAAMRAGPKKEMPAPRVRQPE